MLFRSGCTTTALGAEQALALRLLHCHLGIGMSSRLFVALREEHGLAYDVGVHHPARLGDAPFVMHLSSSAERAAEACRELLNEWQRLLDQPISAGDLELARAKFRGQEALGRQTSSQLADRQALVLGHGLPMDFADRSLEAATQLTPDDLHRAATSLLGRPCLSLCGPTDALLAAEPAGNLNPDLAKKMLARQLAGSAALAQRATELARERALALEEAHRRVRQAAPRPGGRRATRLEAGVRGEPELLAITLFFPAD